MALSYKAGFFTKQATVLTDQDITDVGFQPKALILFSTTTASAVTDNQRSFISFTTGTAGNHRTICFGSSDNATTPANFRSNSDVSAIRQTTSSALEVVATISFLANGFRVSYTSNIASTYNIEYIAIGGDDVTNVKTASFTPNTSTGNQSVTDVGFQPDIVFFMGTNSAVPTATTAIDHNEFFLGVAKSSSEQVVMAAASPEAAASQPELASRISRNDKCILYYTQTPTTTSIDCHAAYVGTTASGTGGFTINITDAPAATAQPIFYLAIKGGGWKVGSVNNSGALTGSQAITSQGFTPKGLFVFGTGDSEAATGATSSDFATNSNKYSFGAADSPASAQRWNVINGDKSGVNPTQSIRGFQGNGAIFRTYCEAATGTASVLQASATLTDFDSNNGGRFVLNWTVTDGIGRQLLYVTTSDTPPPPPPPPPSGAIQVAVGTFQKSGSQTYPVIEPHITGLSFQPKAIMITSIGTGTTSLTSFTDIERPGFGWSAGSTQNYALSWGSDDSTVVATTNTFRRARNDYCYTHGSSGSTTGYPLMKVDSFDSGGVTFRYDLNDTATTRLFYFAVGGEGVGAVKAGHFTPNTTTGNQSITGVGFQPSIVFFLTGNSPPITGTPSTPPHVTPHLSVTLGVAKSSTARGCMALSAVDEAATSDSARLQRDNACIAYFTEGTVSQDALADFVSQDVDGFTINWSDAPSTQQPIFYLAISGGSWNVGTTLARNTTDGLGTRAVTGLDHAPKALMLFGHQGTGTNAIQTNSKYSLGFSDETLTFNTVGGNMDATTIPSSYRSYITTGTGQTTHTIYRSHELGTANANNVASGNEATMLSSRANLTSLDATGFTLDWVNVDASARQLLYVTAGDNVGAAIVKVVNDTLGITEAALNRILGKIRVINETVAITETRNRALGGVKVINETLGITESLVKNTKKLVVFNETIGITESLAPAMVKIRVFNETLGITENLVKIFVTPTSTLQATALQLRYSGGSGNSTTTNSRGGAMSNTAITDNTLNNAWDDVAAAESTPGETEYRCFYLYNTSTTLTAYNFELWVDTTTPAGDSIEIGVGTAAVGGTEQDLTAQTEQFPPSGVTFSTAPDQDSAIPLGNIPPLTGRSIWLKRIVGAGTAAWSDNLYRLRGSLFSNHA